MSVSVSVFVSVCLSVPVHVYVWVSTSERQFACSFVCGWVHGDCSGGVDACQILLIMLNRVCMCSVVCISTVCMRI